MHALILCNDYPPLNSVAAQRPLSWAAYLPDEGIRVTVVAKDWAEEMPFLAAAGSMDGASLEPASARVVRVPHRAVPSRRFAHRFGSGFSGVRRGLTFVEHASAYVTFAMDRHASLHRAASIALDGGDVDLVLTTAEPFVLFRYGALLKARYGVRWAADYRDGWHHSHVGRFDRRPAVRLLRLWEALFERRLLRSADLVTTVDPELARELAAYHGRRVDTVYNGFWDFYSGPRPASTASLVVTHSGTLTDGQQVELLLDAVRELLTEGRIANDDIRLEFLGLEVSTRQVARVRARLREAASCLVTTVRLSREEALARSAAADLLVSLTDPRVHAIYAKTYDYVAARRPIVVIPDDRSILSEFVRASKSGVAVANKAELKDLLHRKVQEKHRGALLAPTALDESYARAYTRREQARVLARLLREAADRSSAVPR